LVILAMDWWVSSFRGLLMTRLSTCRPTRLPAASDRVRGSWPEVAADSCRDKLADRPGTNRLGTTPPAAMPPPNMAATFDSVGTPPPEAMLKP
jgi:hypothetical protein